MPAHVKPREIVYQLNNLVRAFKGRDDAPVKTARPDFSEVEALQVVFLLLFLQFPSSPHKALTTHAAQGLHGCLTRAEVWPFGQGVLPAPGKLRAWQQLLAHLRKPQDGQGWMLNSTRGRGLNCFKGLSENQSLSHTAVWKHKDAGVKGCIRNLSR